MADECKVIRYTRELNSRIRNVNSLPAGTGCRYLLCLDVPEKGTLVAASWHRRMPACKPGYVVVRFGE